MTGETVFRDPSVHREPLVCRERRDTLGSFPERWDPKVRKDEQGRMAAWERRGTRETSYQVDPWGSLDKRVAKETLGPVE